MRYKIGILSTHPIQYYTPWYRELARRAEIDLTVYYAHRATPEDQAAAGFDVAFEWDVPLLDGYPYRFLTNRSLRPGTDHYGGCDTPEIAEIIRRERFDAFLVHGWYTRSFWQAMRACWRMGTPIMVRGDSTLLMASGRIKKLVKWFTHRPFVSRFDAYLVVGRRAREYYLAYGADPDRMEFCPHFVANDWFAAAAAEARLRRAELRRQWGLSEQEVVFLFAGKLIPKKRPLDFIRAVAAIAHERAGVTSLIVGDGPLRAEVETEIKAQAAPVKLIGFLNQRQIPLAYVAGDVLVLPSDGTETWGLVVNEAMACGLPAVVSDKVGCAADLVTDGETGFIYPCGDVPALAAHLQRLADDPKLRAGLAAAARKRINGYSIEGAADALCRALARLSADRRSG
jgi:glycosyltransferase involved in cell wall biosynthesis